MDTIEDEKNESEIIMDNQTCPRHGSRVSRDRRCPRCMIEEVRRAERRLGALDQLEEPVMTGSAHHII